MADGFDPDRDLRDFVRYTGDGLPGAPLNAPLPVGDPTTGPHNVSKAVLRALAHYVQEAGNSASWGLGSSNGIAIPLDDPDAIDTTAFYRFTPDTLGMPLVGSGSLVHIAVRTTPGALRRGVQEATYTIAPYEGRTFRRVFGAAGWSAWTDIGVDQLALAGGYIVDADRSGIASASAAIQAQIALADSAGGGTVIIPPGLYKITTTIMMASNVHVRCQHGAVFNVENLPTSGVTGGMAVRFEGVSAPLDTSGVTFSDHKSSGHTLIQTTDPHGLAVGDSVRVVGQRNAFSADAGRYRLGVGTAGLPTCYFQEFAHVRQVVGSTRVILDRALTFPDYRADNLLETDPNALPASKIIKFEPIVGAKWIGGKFLSRNANTLTSLFSLSMCKDCVVADVEDDRGLKLGTTVGVALSWRCRVENVVSRHSEGFVPDYATQHNATIFVRLTACNECVVSGGYAYGHAQSIDFTYSGTYRFVCFRCVVEGVTIDSASEQAYTSHPGVYGSTIRNNRFLNCYRGGVMLRGVAERVTGNEMTSYQWNVGSTLEGTVPTPAGVLFTSGGGRNSVVDGNRIEGFAYGVFFRDGGPLFFENLSVTIANNNMNNVWRGIDNTISSTRKYNRRRDLLISGNVLENVRSRCFNLGPYMAGVAVVENTFRGPHLSAADDARFLHFDDNCPAFLVENNRIYGMEDDPAPGRVVIRAGPVPDTTTFPAATWQERGRVRNNFGLTLLNFSTGLVPYALIPAGSAS